MIERPDWSRLDTLLDAALDVPKPERARWLEETCGDDDALREALARLLALAERDDDDLTPGGGLSGPLGDEVAGELNAAPTQGPALPAGTVLGPYEVVGLIGSGGMGRVYRAWDPRLGRQVAIKALAGASSGREAALRRFEREARALASITHPSVAAIYEVLRVQGEPYLVLELVEGPTLADRLEAGRLPIDEALAVSVQVAEALEEAHRRGVVHRDLKPANVKLGADGRVKVLDFGLASIGGRGEESAAGAADSSTTAPGAVLGTAAYMSPEQARGGEVDGRSDVWAFGCLLYEMLAGIRAFTGRGFSETLASVLRDPPDWSRLPNTTPPAVRRLLERCLRKDPRRRLQGIGDARIEIQELDAAEAAASRRSSWLPWTVAGGVLAGSALVVLRQAPEQPARTRYLHVDTGPSVALATDYAPPFTVSPDGSTIVFLGREAGTTRLYLRELSGPEVRALAGTEDAWQPFFSPDGRSVGFFADRKLKTVSVAGGTPMAIADVGENPRGAAWGPRGQIVLAPSQTSGLALVGEQGGPLRELTRLDVSSGERCHRWPQFLPGGAAVLFTALDEDGPFDEARIEAVDLATGDRTRLFRGGAYGRYASSGHLVFARTGGLFAVPLDPAARRVTAVPRLVLENVAYDARNGATKMALSDAGDLVYVLAPPVPLERRLRWLHPDGQAARVSGVPRRFRDPRLSPDGQRIAVVIATDQGADAWVLDASSGTLSQVTFGRRPWRPTWTPDGRAITLGLDEGGRWRLVNVAADGGFSGTPLVESDHRLYPCAWSPDGRRLIYQERRPESGWDLFAITVDESGRPAGEPLAIAATPHHEEGAVVSADGAWVAYESDEVDELVEVYVAPLFRPGSKVRATTSGARWPYWTRSGELLYWHSTQHEIRRLVPHGGAGRWTARESGPADPGTSRTRLVYPPESRGYDYHPATGRFLVFEPPPTVQPTPPPRIVIALSWLQDLRARLSTR